MSEYQRVTTADDLATLDDAEMVEGYLDGFKGEPEPRGNRSRSYHHGWNNGRNDREKRVDEEQRMLVEDVARCSALARFRAALAVAKATLPSPPEEAP